MIVQLCDECEEIVERTEINDMSRYIEHRDVVCISCHNKPLSNEEKLLRAILGKR